MYKQQYIAINTIKAFDKRFGSYTATFISGTTDEGSCIATETFGFISLLIGEENYNVKYTTQLFRTSQQYNKSS